jgi:hypothetical protein
LSSLYPFGQVKDGALNFKTYVTYVLISASRSKSEWSVLGGDGGSVTISLDNLIITDVVEVTFALLFVHRFRQPGKNYYYDLIVQKADSDSFRRIGIFWQKGLYGGPKFHEASLTIV